MRRQVLMSLLVTVVFGDVVEVVPADDDGAGHLRGHDTAGQDATTDGNFTSEGAFLINVGSANGIRRRLEAQADILVPPLIFGGDLLSNTRLRVLEERLLLESLFDLIGHT